MLIYSFSFVFEFNTFARTSDRMTQWLSASVDISHWLVPPWLSGGLRSRSKWLHSAAWLAWLFAWCSERKRRSSVEREGVGGRLVVCVDGRGGVCSGLVRRAVWAGYNKRGTMTQALAWAKSQCFPPSEAIVVPMVISLSTNLNGSDPICVSALRKWTEPQGAGVGKLVVGDLFQDP